MDDEIYPVVDENDQVTAAIISKEKLHESKLLHRCVHVFVEVFGGLFLLQKKADKPGIENAGKWSSAVSGHVLHSESYEDAAVRETFEELGLVIPKEDLKKITKTFPTEDNGFEFITLFTYLLDPSTEFPRITDEVEEILITSLKGITKDVKEHPEKYSKPFLELFKIFLAFEEATVVKGDNDDIQSLSNHPGL